MYLRYQKDITWRHGIHYSTAVQKLYYLWMYWLYMCTWREGLTSGCSWIHFVLQSNWKYIDFSTFTTLLILKVQSAILICCVSLRPSQLWWQQDHYFHALHLPAGGFQHECAYDSSLPLSPSPSLSPSISHALSIFHIWHYLPKHTHPHTFVLSPL